MLMLRLDDVHTYYGESHILQGVNMKVSQGSIAALLGRNGMGKTTTINTINGFKHPAAGVIVFKGRNIGTLPSHQIAQMGMALVPQGRRIFPSLTVKENLTIGSRNHRHTRHNYNLESIYELFPVLKSRSKHLGNQLSGGEQQMLAIGRALMTNPDFLLMDEPFEGLAPAIVKEIGRKIHELKKTGLSILLVEQNVRVALSLADYIYIMNKGKVIFGGTPTETQIEENIKKLIAL